MTFNILTLHKPFLFLFSCFIYFVGEGQGFSEKKYPQGYFVYPVEAQSIALAANFGELRPDHFHMGLDCKTDHRENLVVHASADGYVARVKIEPFGFGRAIYINHPNGFTTLYAHLNEFYPELEAYVKQQQYKLQSWQVFLDIPKGMFPVKQRQMIARSGNTGGSQGPHTHFEIRDTKTDKNVNPLLFGLPIPDAVPPTVVSLAMYNRDLSTYNQHPRMLALSKKGGSFSPAVMLITTTFDKVSFGINAFDQLSGSANHNGIYEAVLYEDGKAIVGFKLDNFSYDETRYVNANVDYKLKMNGGPYIQHLSRLPGNPEGIYKDFSGNGVIDVTDKKMHHIKIVVKDANGNSSSVVFDVQDIGVTKHSVNHNNETGTGVEFEPGLRNIFENDEVGVMTDDKAVYDSFALNIVTKSSVHNENALSEIFSIAPDVPLQTAATIKIKPEGKLTSSARPIIKRSYKGKSEVMKAVREQDMYKANFRAFGDFQLLDDETPPVISVSFANNANLAGVSNIVINVKDDNDDVKNFKALLDGKWLRFTNDKEKAFIYKMDEMCGPGKHELRISVQDEAGNIANKTLSFTR